MEGVQAVGAAERETNAVQRNREVTAHGIEIPDRRAAAHIVLCMDFHEGHMSPLYSDAERATLDFAVAAASVPNAVTDAMFAELRQHWTEEQIVEIVGVISLFGFLSRWNDP